MFWAHFIVVCEHCVIQRESNDTCSAQLRRINTGCPLCLFTPFLFLPALCVCLCFTFANGALYRFCQQAFSAPYEVYIWTRKEAESLGRGGGSDRFHCFYPVPKPDRDAVSETLWHQPDQWCIFLSVHLICTQAPHAGIIVSFEKCRRYLIPRVQHPTPTPMPCFTTPPLPSLLLTDKLILS